MLVEEVILVGIDAPNGHFESCLVATLDGLGRESAAAHRRMDTALNAPLDSLGSELIAEILTLQIRKICTNILQ